MIDAISPANHSFRDPWVLGSLLQKAIRRGDLEIAIKAWSALGAIDAKRAWRRLMFIAFEDIGIADNKAVSDAAILCLSKEPSVQAGRVLVARLARAGKDRSTDYLFCSCIRHPSLNLKRRDADQASPDDNLRMIASNCNLESRALSVIMLLRASKGRRAFGWTRAATVRAIVERVTDDATMRGLIETAFRKSGEPYLLMLPLLTMDLSSQKQTSLAMLDVPASIIVDGVPMYALDKHTRVGRAAIREFIADNNNVRRSLAKYVTPESMKSAAYMAAYYTDATPITNRFVWSDSDRLEIRGREADMYFAGVPLEGVAPILETFRANLFHLDEIRARLFRKKFGGGNR